VTFVDDDGCADSHFTAVRVEWSKAKARRDRWVEEVQLLRKEMKRVLCMLRTIQAEWSRRAEQRKEIDSALANGLKAYAKRQVHIHRSIAEAFHAGWNGSVASAVRQVMERDACVHRELLEGTGVDRAPSPSRANCSADREASIGVDGDRQVEQVTERVTRARAKGKGKEKVTV
jgi:hypothetical protein